MSAATTEVTMVDPTVLSTATLLSYEPKERLTRKTEFNTIGNYVEKIGMALEMFRSMGFVVTALKGRRTSVRGRR